MSFLPFWILVVQYLLMLFCIFKGLYNAFLLWPPYYNLPSPAPPELPYTCTSQFNILLLFFFLSTYRVQLVLPICTGVQGHLLGHWHSTRINTLRGINLHHPLQPSTINVVVSRRLVSIFLSPTLKCSLNSGWDRGMI